MRSTLLTSAVLLAMTTGVATAGEFDMYAPSWRGGQYSLQVAWTWGSAPSDLTHMIPVTSVFVNGGVPGVLQNTPAFGAVNEPERWVWTNNAGQPGLHSDGGSGPYGTDFHFFFPYWDRGGGLEPTRFRLQITYDGPAPDLLAPPGLASPEFGGDSHHMYVDQAIETWVWSGIGMSARPGTILREARIDTILVPEPGACLLLGLSALAARRRR